MTHTYLLHHLIEASAERSPDAMAVKQGERMLTYAALAAQVQAVAAGLRARGVQRQERVAILLSKTPEFVAAAFGASRAGAVFVPVNPILKPEQVAHILNDCQVRVLVTAADRLVPLVPALRHCPHLRDLVVVGNGKPAELPGVIEHRWAELVEETGDAPSATIDSDLAAILYTSGSTGRPKGVVLTHRNMVTGAKSVASYLANQPPDRLLAVLPLSFDAGFSQLTTAFHAGARAVLLDYLLPNEVIRVVEREEITGLTAVPPLWIQLSHLEWPSSVTRHLRYLANTGGRMPREVLARLRGQLPQTLPYLMYGLTEAFRSTYLPPAEVDSRPDSIGKAIPNAEILVLRPDGSPCGPNEPGELVHRGPLVSQGYWNNPEQTAERFKPLPRDPAVLGGLVFPEMAVFSGDTVRMDDEGYLYFIGRQDEMIKTSGYRLSPLEVEEAIYAAGIAAEVAAFGIPHARLGQVVGVVVTPPEGRALDGDDVLAACRERLANYMVPALVDVRAGPLPRNSNGKIDRKLLAAEFVNAFAEVTA